ncbi:hypothetical protein GJ496_010128 [Pomphorhynchus laevis]|nr:hypothetical protein GJ496_010128 [Pomphorhynchus laevis]
MSKFSACYTIQYTHIIVHLFEKITSDEVVHRIYPNREFDANVSLTISIITLIFLLSKILHNYFDNCFWMDTTTPYLKIFVLQKFIWIYLQSLINARYKEE